MIWKNLQPPSSGSKCMPSKKPAEIGSKHADTPLQNISLSPMYMMLKLRRTALFMATTLGASNIQILIIDSHVI
jgi:hypothetical protein